MSSRYVVHRGFVAIMVTLVMSAMMTILMLSLAQTGWYTRFMVLSGEYKSMSRALARSCLDEVIARLEAGETYIGNATTTSEIGSCYVSPIDRSASLLTVRLLATVETVHTNLVATLDPGDLHMSPTPETTSSAHTGRPTMTVSHVSEVSE